MLAEAASACLYAGNPAEMLAVAERARAKLPDRPSARARFLAASAIGMAHMFGGDAAAGAGAVHEADVALAENSAGLCEDLQLIPWLALGPLFLREAAAGRSLLRQALQTARDRAAVGALPLVLSLIARHEAATDSWAVAEATYREAIDLARESGQRSDLAFGLAGLAWLLARRGRETECRASAADALGPAMSLARGSPRSGRRQRSASWSWAGGMRLTPLSTSSISGSCCVSWRSPTPICRPHRNSLTPT